MQLLDTMPLSPGHPGLNPKPNGHQERVWCELRDIPGALSVCEFLKTGLSLCTVKIYTGIMGVLSRGYLRKVFNKLPYKQHRPYLLQILRPGTT